MSGGGGGGMKLEGLPIKLKVCDGLFCIVFGFEVEFWTCPAIVTDTAFCCGCENCWVFPSLFEEGGGD